MTEPAEQELDLIAVGAHPDDVEIACGGTLARLVRKGYTVGIVDLTDGEPTPHSPGPDVRLAEARPGRRDPGRRDPDQPEPAQPQALRLVRGPRCPGQGLSPAIAPRSCSGSAARPCSPLPTITRRC